MLDEALDGEFIGYPCYEFNGSLEPGLNDTRCVHCQKYLTVECEFLDEFLEDEGDES